MKYGSVCSGIEAASAAWHGLGWQPSFFSEIEAFPRAVLAHHYPDVPLHGDFTTIEADQYEPIDLLVGGTPCQSFSIAGLRGGLDDDRGNLALQFLRLADRTRARWVVWENVPGVLSSNGGRDFGSILGGLGKLGYGWAYRVLDAQFFGVAQRRRRVFVVGYLGDWRRAAAVLFERHSLSGHPAPRRETGKSVAKDAIGRTASGRDTFGTLTAKQGEKQWLGNQEALSGDYHVMAPTISPCLETQKGGLRGPDTQAYVVGALPASLGKGLGHNKDDFCVATAFDWQSGGDSRGLDPKPTAQLQRSQVPAVAYPINTQMALRGADTSNTSREGVGIGGENDPAFTLQAAHSHAVAFEENMSLQTPSTNGVNPTLTRRTHASVAIQSAVRRLTPRECERLQGFPDDYTSIPYRNKPAEQCPDGPRYKALGNSMAVPVMRWIGERIKLVEQITGDIGQ